MFAVGIWVDITAAAIVGALGFGGGAVALIFNGRRAKRVRASGTSPLFRKGTVCLAASRTDAVEYILRAIKSSGGSVTSQDPSEGQVFAKYGITRRSWGQYLQVDLWDTDLGEQQCVCTSWPTQDFVLTEWGEGNRLIRRFIATLNELTPLGTVVGETTSGRTLDFQ
jgi:hypothetical protein